jgi:hypothetical protein
MPDSFLHVFANSDVMGALGIGEDVGPVGHEIDLDELSRGRGTPPRNRKVKHIEICQAVNPASSYFDNPPSGSVIQRLLFGALVFSPKCGLRYGSWG